MAHLVESMAFTGSTPWHGLGNALQPRQPLSVWEKQAGFDWSIEESPVNYVVNGVGHLGEVKEYGDHKVLYRSDTRTPLSVVGTGYNVVQPQEILEFYRDLTEQAGFELETAGVLKGGKKLWALARTGQTSMIKGHDRTDGFLLLATACDGSMATTAQFTSIRVVCNNTLAIALNGESSGVVKVRHNTVFDADKVKAQLGISVTSWNAFSENMEQLADRRVNRKGAESFFTQVFTQNESLNAKAANRALELFQGQGRGSELRSSRNTAYGLLNAVTEFIDHERRARTTDHRLDSAWFGQGAAIKQQALNLALKLAA